MIKTLRVGVLLVGFAILLSCSSGNKPVENGAVIAKVGSATLNPEDISGLNFGDNAEDSLMLLSAFAHKWVEEQVLYQRAQKELASSSSIFERQLEAYKKSLFIYSFQQQLVGESMDTAISDQAVEAYYLQNEKHFLLKTDIVKFRLAIFPSKAKPPAKIRAMFSDLNSKKIPALESFLRVNSKSFFLNDTAWISVSDVSKLLPSSLELSHEKLSKKSFIELNDSTGLHWLWIQDVKMKKTVSPLEFEIPRIRAILLHQKKQIFLKDLERKWVQQALTEKTAEIYVGKSNP
ncbi:MAG: hypothetical protein FJZ75_05240 [Bacteroidetes bacterium]|nr:hypothetical protein [Bacteroidota bacterium]